MFKVKWVLKARDELGNMNIVKEFNCAKEAINYMTEYKIDGMITRRKLYGRKKKSNCRHNK